jgi:hypothetical protein
VAAAALVLVPSATAASLGQAPGSVAHATGAPVTLTVSIIGDGFVSGGAAASPPDISCGSTCSAQFPSGTEIVLDPLPAQGGWGFPVNGWSVTPPYLCNSLNIRDPSQCYFTLDDSLGTAVSVQATFTYGPSPPPCTVPGVRGAALAKAKTLIKESHCALGNVRYGFSRKVKKGRVISQNPLKGWQREQTTAPKVNLVVSKGRRKHHTTTRNRHGAT